MALLSRLSRKGKYGSPRELILLCREMANTNNTSFTFYQLQSSVNLISDGWKSVRYGIASGVHHEPAGDFWKSNFLYFTAATASRNAGKLLTYRYEKSLSERARLPYRRIHGVKIGTDPEEVLVDERFAIIVRGLACGANATIQASIREGNVVYTSSGCYQADDTGCVDVTNQRCLAGSYQGTDGMGLVWSMTLATGQKEGLLLNKKDVTTPQVVSLSVFDGHYTSEELFDMSPVPLSSTIVQRWYKAKDMQKIEVKDGAIRGSLFLPPGPGPFPAVLDMYGTAGGLIDSRASLLASRGFITLALAYFGYQDLPKNMEDVDIAYLKEAVDFLPRCPKSNQKGIGLLGISRGGELCQFIALQCPQVRAVVIINSRPYLSISSIRNGDKIIEPMKTIDSSKFVFTKDNCLIFKDSVYTAEKVPYFPLWEKDVALLNICGTDDHVTDHRLQLQQYNDFPSKDKIELVVYDGAGHMIDPPYSPVMRKMYHKVYRLTFLNGGIPSKHSYAQKDSWMRIQRFLRTHLT